jgi:replicative DNA helicase
MTDAPVNPTAIPHNREAEEALIGSVLINPEAFYDVTQIVKSSDFHIHRHMWIWHSFAELSGKGMDIDLITVANMLERDGKLNDVGGPAYLTSLLNATASSLNAVSYAQIIKATSIRRQYIKIANNIAQVSYDEKQDVNAFPSMIRDALETVDTRDNTFVHISKPLSEIYDEIETAELNPQDIWGLPTGLHKFDVSTGGIDHKNLVWLVGEPGIGKTWSLTQFALSFADKEPGALISMEMSSKSVVRRALSGLSTIRIKSMRSGIGLPHNWREIFGDAAGVLEQLPIYISDKTMNTDYLRASLKALKREFGIGWFGVDYALLFDDHAENEISRTEIISRNLKHICNDLDLAGVVLQSVVKSGMDNNISGKAKSSMRGSGQMIHDADMILFLTNFEELDEADMAIREVERKRMVTLHTTKGRDLETYPVGHLIRRDNSPFFDEYDAEKLRRARANQPSFENKEDE